VAGTATAAADGVADDRLVAAVFLREARELFAEEAGVLFEGLVGLGVGLAHPPGELGVVSGIEAVPALQRVAQLVGQPGGSIGEDGAGQVLLPGVAGLQLLLEHLARRCDLACEVGQRPGGLRGVDLGHGAPGLFQRRDQVGERQEGRGLDVAFGGFLTPSRIAVGMTCVGLARRAQELAIEHARTRVTFGKPLAGRQAIAFSLAENAADIEAARQLVLHAAREWEAGSPDAAMLSSMAKLTAVDMITRVTDKALQVFGGIGFWNSSPIERVYRDARAQRFEEGTNEIQKTIIARSILA